jgi:hypothetical protein
MTFVVSMMATAAAATVSVATIHEEGDDHAKNEH